jgi:TonB family protein
MNKKVLSQKSPQAVMLTKLDENFLHAAFGAENLDHLISQELGAQRATDFESDRFRAGFWFCFHGPPPGLPARIEESPNPTFGAGCDWRKFQNVLAAYKHPAEGISGTKARLLDSGGYRLLKYVAAQYPQVAVQARVQANMELELNVNQKTGYVENVTVSGHPLLLRAAEEAAKQWQFDPTQAIQNPVKATLDFSTQCSQ